MKFWNAGVIFVGLFKAEINLNLNQSTKIYIMKIKSMFFERDEFILKQCKGDLSSWLKRLFRHFFSISSILGPGSHTTFLIIFVNCAGVNLSSIEVDKKKGSRRLLYDGPQSPPF